MQEKGYIAQLMQALQCLPGVGPKSAQRMTFHLLQRDRQGARNLAQILQLAVEKIGHCEQCRTLSENSVCELCSNPSRDPSIICVVETPADVYAVDQVAIFKGRYFVLHGRLSPLDGIGPEDLGLDLLESRLASSEVNELILATNSTVEGEATAHYIAGIAHQHKVKATRIAHGVPVGGELEYIDSGTLAHAFGGRTAL